MGVSPRITEWRKLPVSLTELCINTSLRCGQSFRWRKSENNEWSCAIHGRILSLRQDPTHLHYRAIFPTRASGIPTPPSSAPASVVTSADEDDTPELIRHYFNLDTNLTSLYEKWSSADANFKKKAPKFTGVRILRQDAWEALLGFICSSNNNIIRISQMMANLCLHYGPLIGHIASEPFHDLPLPSALTGPQVESHLRQLGFGYRAKYIHQTAILISEKGSLDWLDGLRNPENPVLGHLPKSAGKMEPQGRPGYREAHEQLLGLQGVGPKVADCVCLMGLGWGEAVPVDTHVWQIAQRDYKFGKGKHKSLTKITYDAIGDHFRSLWGKEAGWAHSVLFTADLRAFSERLVAKVEVKEEMVVKSEGGVKVKLEESITETVLTDGFGVKREASSEDEKDIVSVKIEDDARAKRARKRRRI